MLLEVFALVMLPSSALKCFPLQCFSDDKFNSLNEELTNYLSQCSIYVVVLFLNLMKNGFGHTPEFYWSLDYGGAILSKANHECFQP